MQARRSYLVEEERDRRRGEVEDQLRAPEATPALARRPLKLVEELSPGAESPALVTEPCGFCNTTVSQLGRLPAAIPQI